jgi:hypothetical protein
MSQTTIDTRYRAELENGTAIFYLMGVPVLTMPSDTALVLLEDLRMQVLAQRPIPTDDPREDAG